MSNLKLLLAICFFSWACPVARCGNMVAFAGHQFILTAGQDEADGGALNQYVAVGQNSTNWTVLLLARDFPTTNKVGDVANGWLTMIKPMLLQPPVGYRNRSEPSVLIIMAWLKSSDKASVEVNYYLARPKEGGGVETLQYVQRLPVDKDGKADLAGVVAKKAADLDELAVLRLPIVRGP